MSPDSVTIAQGASRCTLCPALGGGITSWVISGQDMLHHADADDLASHDPLRLSSFPLVPYSNRIADGQFNQNARPVSITRNFTPEPHAIHGIGWTRPWTVEAHTENTVTLTLSHRGDADWPWPFTAHQMISVTPEALLIDMKVRNDFDEAVPLAFGHHPYFDQDGAALGFIAAHVALNGSTMLPEDSVAPFGPFDFAAMPDVAGRSVDHGFSGWDGTAHIRWRGRPLGLVITSDLPASVVYIPLDGDAFCFEPVPHCTNAINRAGAAHAMPVVEPGDSFAATIRLTAVAADQMTHA